MSEAVILVVEDEPSFVEALNIGLVREGFTVHVAVDGVEALEQFDAVGPDLVLLDVMLPRLSGIEVCRQIRKKSRVPIIMVTAKSAEIDTVVGLEVGADDYVTKPYRIRELACHAKHSSTGFGAMITLVTPRPSTCTLSGSAASSKPTRASLS